MQLSRVLQVPCRTRFCHTLDTSALKKLAERVTDHAEVGRGGVRVGAGVDRHRVAEPPGAYRVRHAQLLQQRVDRVPAVVQAALRQPGLGAQAAELVGVPLRVQRAAELVGADIPAVDITGVGGTGRGPLGLVQRLERGRDRREQRQRAVTALGLRALLDHLAVPPQPEHLGAAQAQQRQQPARGQPVTGRRGEEPPHLLFSPRRAVGLPSLDAPHPQARRKAQERQLEVGAARALGAWLRSPAYREYQDRTALVSDQAAIEAFAGRLA